MSTDNPDAVSNVTIAAELHRDASYFSLAYDEWLHHRSRYRKIALPISIALLAAGGVSIVAFGLLFSGFALLAAGLHGLVEVLTHKSRSIAAMKKAITNQDLELRFGESSIEVRAGGQTEVVAYASFERIHPTPRGVFLVVAGTQSTTFVPFSTLSPASSADRFLAMFHERIPGLPFRNESSG